MADTKRIVVPMLAAAAASLAVLTTTTMAEPPKDAAKAPETKSGLIAMLRASSKKVAPGSKLPLTYEVRNASQTPVTLRFSDGQRTEMTATSIADGKVVWRSSEGKMFNMMVGGAVWQPGETKRFSETWAVGADVKPGRYRIGAYLTMMGTKSAGATKSAQPSLAETVVEVGVSVPHSQ